MEGKSNNAVESNLRAANDGKSMQVAMFDLVPHAFKIISAACDLGTKGRVN